MNNVDILLELVEREPRCDVYAACLTDALIEDRGMLHTEAARQVAQVRADSLTAADICFAADLIARRGTAWHGLLQEVENQAKLSGVESFTLFVVGGAEPPSICPQSNDVNPRGPGRNRAVRLPATWVREWHERTRLPLGKALAKKASRPRRQHVRRPVK